MFSPYLKRILIDICLCIALAMGIFYCKEVYIDFLISLFHFSGKVNISSISYCLQRFILVFLPLIMLTAMSGKKNRVLQILFAIIGCTYLLANLWTISYIAAGNPISDLFYASVPSWASSGEFKEIVDNASIACYQFQYDNAYVFNYIVWDSYNLFAVLFSLIQGVLYIDLAKNLRNHKSIVINKYVIMTLASILLPLLYGWVVERRPLFTDEWGQRNVLLLFESLFIFVAMKLAGTARQLWSDLLY